MHVLQVFQVTLVLFCTRKLIQDLDNVIKNRVVDDSSSLDRDELYVYIEDKIQTDGFVQRAVSVTSIHNAGRNTSLLALQPMCSLLVVMIIITSFAPISSNIKLSGATQPRD